MPGQKDGGPDCRVALRSQARQTGDAAAQRGAGAGRGRRAERGAPAAGSHRTQFPAAPQAPAAGSRRTQFPGAPRAAARLPPRRRRRGRGQRVGGQLRPPPDGRELREPFRPRSARDDWRARRLRPLPLPPPAPGAREPRRPPQMLPGRAGRRPGPGEGSSGQRSGLRRRFRGAPRRPAALGDPVSSPIGSPRSPCAPLTADWCGGSVGHLLPCGNRGRPGKRYSRLGREEVGWAPEPSWFIVVGTVPRRELRSQRPGKEPVAGRRAGWRQSAASEVRRRHLTLATSQ